MKFTLLLFIVLQINLFSQIREISPEVKELFESFQEISTYYNLAEKQYNKNFSIIEVQELARKYYKALSNDPIGYKTQFLKNYKEFSERQLKNSSVEEINPKLKRGIFLDILYKHYGRKFINIIEIPYT